MMTTPETPQGSGARRAPLVVAVLVALAVGAGLGAAGMRLAGGAHGAHGAAPAASAGGSAAGATDGRKVLYWYDPMVPGQKFDQPGKSPFMDMDLVPKYADEAAGDGSGVTVDPRVVANLGVRLAHVTEQREAAEVSAAGTVQLDERQVAIVQARTAGFVERVYGRAAGDVVAAGSPLVDLLVPEWAGAQREYVAIKATGDAPLAAAARQRLVLLGMNEAQLAELDRTGEVKALTTVTTPIGGLIQELMVRPGMSVMPAMTLARVNGLSTVWLEAALPEAQAATVRPGQPAEARFPALPGEVVRGRVDTVLPEANRDTRTLRVRIVLPNPGGRLRSGLYAQVTLRGPEQAVRVVPAEAVIRTGRRAFVYVVDAPGRFRPVPVTLGADLGDRLVVRDGLAAGQQIVASGQFLIDSEATLQGLLPPEGAAADGEPELKGPQGMSR